ncbi:MAG: DUF6694 family lipoprotein [Phycisphaerales bacterium]
MKNLKHNVLAIALAVLAGCSDPTIDASSDESMKQSVKKVREALPESKRVEFDEALQVLAFSKINMKDLFAEGAMGAGNLEGKVRDSLDGKTGEQVIAAAERIRAERKGRERQQALEEIRELEAKRTKSESARDQLKNFEVVRSRFYIREIEYVGKVPVIELTVRNGTSVAVSRAYFEGTLASPDRSVPWLKNTFNHSIPGGLEPGEEASWDLMQIGRIGWGSIDPPADAVFTVTVERLDGPDGEPIYSTGEFSKYDQKRLNKLKDKYGVE